MFHRFMKFLLFVFGTYFIAAEGSERLVVDKTLFNQIFDKEAKVYTVDELSPDASYEVRVSYSAAIPTDFVLHVEPIEGKHLNRRILNVEQLQWKAVQKEYIIKVTGHRTGLPVDLERLNDPVPFNIIVNRLYFGCSIATWKILVACLLTNIVMLKLAIPKLLKFMEDQLGEDSKKE